LAKRSKAVRGIAALIKKIEQHKAKIAKGLERGLTKAGLWLLRESMKVVPVDTSALKNSAPNVTRKEGSGFNTVFIVGYGMDYAVYVHENINARHKPGKMAKFLEIPARYGRDDMAELVMEELQ
jgi:hypothetical protein